MANKQKELPTTQFEAFNIFIQVCNAYQGDRADFQKIEAAIDIFKKLPSVKKAIKSIEAKKEKPNGEESSS